MGHGIGAHLLRDLDLFLGDQRARDRGAQQIDALVQRIGAEHGEDIVAHEFLAQIFDEDVLGLDAQGERLLARGLDLGALAQIGGEGHDLGAIFGLQPFEDHRRVQPARIGEDHFLHISLGHWKAIPEKSQKSGDYRDWGSKIQRGEGGRIIHTPGMVGQCALQRQRHEIGPRIGRGETRG